MQSINRGQIHGAKIRHGLPDSDVSDLTSLVKNTGLTVNKHRSNEANTTSPSVVLQKFANCKRWIRCCVKRIF